jgi:thiaminase
MENGSITNEEFILFLSQNRMLLKENSGNVAVLSARMQDADDSQTLLSLSQSMYTEYMFSHQFMNSLGEINNSASLSVNQPLTATLSYYSFLFKACSQFPISSAIASLLPSLIGHYEMGNRYRKTVKDVYRPLFTYYGSSKQKNMVEDIIGMYNALEYHDPGDQLIFRLAANLEIRYLDEAVTGNDLI